MNDDSTDEAKKAKVDETTENGHEDNGHSEPQPTTESAEELPVSDQFIFFLCVLFYKFCISLGSIDLMVTYF